MTATWVEGEGEEEEEGLYLQSGGEREEEEGKGGKRAGTHDGALDLSMPIETFISTERESIG